MEDLFQEIEKGLSVGLYHMALGLTLCIPDMCAALQSENGQTTGKKYRNWYRENFTDDQNLLSAEDCYSFRCSFLHQGTTQENGSRYARIVFAEPGPMTMHNNVFINKVKKGNELIEERVLNIDIEIFCTIMINSASRWIQKVKDTEVFKRNSEKAFSKYPEGLSPYIVGVPVYS
ncbi:hypothetical protein NOM01_10940 [Sporolactobacillus sp. STSJ-5]|uniref:hypothetical protein n=1 Tax=Sporolactobacillus sp. STSJ-5 TaxID=2965076 RepID=UPI002104AD64|nr:hypothetical protein [Sporolactobacillus sp. STSJ-5]MCQ2010531.1 hypothetical protein [Sporolactobacillus sp. STSJ-5]